MSGAIRPLKYMRQDAPPAAPASANQSRPRRRRARRRKNVMSVTPRSAEGVRITRLKWMAV